MKEFLCGIKHGLPIGIGYLAVSFAFGIKAIEAGLDWLQAGLMSLLNVTSAGQAAGIEVISTAKTFTAGIISIVLTQFIINLRYALMGFSLNQKLDSLFTLPKRAVVAFTNTDEIFAVAISRDKRLTFTYMLGLGFTPVIGWTLGTVLGAIAGNILPQMIISALGIALYGMFISIVMPVAKEQKSVLAVVIIAIALSCTFAYVPVIKEIESGLSIVICTVISSLIGAICFPVNKEAE